MGEAGDACNPQGMEESSPPSFASGSCSVGAAWWEVGKRRLGMSAGRGGKACAAAKLTAAAHMPCWQVVARCGRIRDQWGELVPEWVDTAGEPVQRCWPQ